MLLRCPSNTVFILRLAKAGFSVAQIHDRIYERMVWHGPYPNGVDIIRFLLEHGYDDQREGEGWRNGTDSACVQQDSVE